MELKNYSTEDDIDKCTEKLTLVKEAEESIPKVEGNGRKKAGAMNAVIQLKPEIKHLKA